MRKRRERIPKQLQYAGIALLAVFLIFTLAKKINLDFLSSGSVKTQKNLTGAAFGITDLFKSIKNISIDRKTIDNLNDRNVYLDMENQLLTAENDRLKRQLQLRTESGLKRYIKCSATVIGENEDGFVQYYLIDRGQSSGVAESDGVVAATGVLGRIVNVMPDSARVQLLTDAKSSISVRVERNKVVGILTGKGLNLCGLDYVPKEEDVVVGDVLVTSGLGKSFPEGIKVGKVTEVDKKAQGLLIEVKVKPFVDIPGTQEVIIVSK